MRNKKKVIMGSLRSFLGIFDEAEKNRQSDKICENCQKSLNVNFLVGVNKIRMKITRFHFVIKFDPEVAEIRSTRRWQAYVP